MLWYFDTVLAVASKICTGKGSLSTTFYKLLEEAWGIAQSTLFGPVGEGGRPDSQVKLVFGSKGVVI